jgi:peptidoglycan/LPS O-acetylase OafA/YrhL
MNFHLTNSFHEMNWLHELRDACMQNWQFFFCSPSVFVHEITLLWSLDFEEHFLQCLMMIIIISWMLFVVCCFHFLLRNYNILEIKYCVNWKKFKRNSVTAKIFHIFLGHLSKLCLVPHRRVLRIDKCLRLSFIYSLTPIQYAST